MGEPVTGSNQKPEAVKRFACRSGLVFFGSALLAALSVAPAWAQGLPLPSDDLNSPAGALALLGLFSLGLWVRQRAESGYLWFALATFASLLIEPLAAVGLSPWARWFSAAASSAAILLICLAMLRLARLRQALIERSMAALALSGILISLPWSGPGDFRPFQIGIDLLVAVIGSQYLAWRAMREPSAELRWLALALTSGLALVTHDLFMLAGWAWMGQQPLTPLAILLLAAGFLYAVQRRFSSALLAVEAGRLELNRQLARQSAELQAEQQQMREAEIARALLQERQRLMQDMHDGLGSSLLSAMVAVEQGSMEQDKVVEVLRECVDDLRLVIDSLEPLGHDLVSLLATMRYRLGKRLQAGGLTLEWDVQDLPSLDWLEPPDALHVLRILQEALSNVLKHSRAIKVRMVTRFHGSYVEIRVEDDGLGFDVDNAQLGRGLRSQQRRAARLGGTLHIDASPGGGTRLSLLLPVSRDKVEDGASGNH
jgi:signal transduction histidine kinase